MKTDSILANRLLSFGFRVFIRPNRDTTLGDWCVFSDGTRLGYAQNTRYRGVSFSTMHKPNRQTGTGFSMGDGLGEDFTKEQAEKAFTFAPEWASESDRRSVAKYPSIEAWLKADKWNLGYEEATQ